MFKAAQIIDLSQTIDQSIPVYPGDPEVEVTPAGVFDKDGYNDHLVSIGTHVGTHIDAPLHMLKDGKTLDQIPVEQFVGRGCYIKIENKIFDLDKIKQTDVREGDIVIFDTGMNKLFGQDGYFEEHLEILEEVAKFLIGKKVKMVGVDMASPDNPPFKIHKLLLSAEVLIIENMTNVAELAGKEFTIYALPIKLNLDGAPARVIAAIS